MDESFIGLRNLLLLATFIQVFASINTIVMRLNYYVLVFLPILIPKVKINCKREFKRISYVAELVMMVFFTFYFFYNGYTGADILNIYPYIPMWI